MGYEFRFFLFDGLSSLRRSSVGGEGSPGSPYEVSPSESLYDSPRISVFALTGMDGLPARNPWSEVRSDIYVACTPSIGLKMRSGAELEIKIRSRLDSRSGVEKWKKFPLSSLAASHSGVCAFRTISKRNAFLHELVGYLRSNGPRNSEYARIVEQFLGSHVASCPLSSSWDHSSSISSGMNSSISGGEAHDSLSMNSSHSAPTSHSFLTDIDGDSPTEESTSFSSENSVPIPDACTYDSSGDSLHSVSSPDRNVPFIRVSKRRFNVFPSGYKVVVELALFNICIVDEFGEIVESPVNGERYYSFAVEGEKEDVLHFLQNTDCVERAQKLAYRENEPFISGYPGFLDEVILSRVSTH